jgi:hypothetical protein
MSVLIPNTGRCALIYKTPQKPTHGKEIKEEETKKERDGTGLSLLQKLRITENLFGKRPALLMLMYFKAVVQVWNI